MFKVGEKVILKSSLADDMTYGPGPKVGSIGEVKREDAWSPLVFWKDFTGGNGLGKGYWYVPTAHLARCSEDKPKMEKLSDTNRKTIERLVEAAIASKLPFTAPDIAKDARKSISLPFRNRQVREIIKQVVKKHPQYSSHMKHIRDIAGGPRRGAKGQWVKEWYYNDKLDCGTIKTEKTKKEGVNFNRGLGTDSNRWAVVRRDVRSAEENDRIEIDLSKIQDKSEVKPIPNRRPSMLKLFKTAAVVILTIGTLEVYRHLDNLQGLWNDSLSVMHDVPVEAWGGLALVGFISQVLGLRAYRKRQYSPVDYYRDARSVRHGVTLGHVAGVLLTLPAIGCCYGIRGVKKGLNVRIIRDKVC